MSPGAETYVRATQLQSNWLQIMEGDIDTSHVAFLHYGGLRAEDQIPGSFSELQLREKTAHYEVIDTEGGAAYGARKPAGPDQVYWRIAQWCFPFYTFTAGRPGTKRGGTRVPLDDEHTVSKAHGQRPQRVAPATSSGAPMQPQPPTDWFGRFSPEQTSTTPTDRTSWQNAAWPGYRWTSAAWRHDRQHGPHHDRSREHLGTTDAMIIRVHAA